MPLPILACFQSYSKCPHTLVCCYLRLRMLLFFLMVMTVAATAAKTKTPPQNHLHLQQQQQTAMTKQPIPSEEKVHLREFHDLRLNCSCPPPSSEVRWSKDGSPLDAPSNEEENSNNNNNNLNSNADNKKQSNSVISAYSIITTDPRLSQLVIEKANSTDIGDYQCYTVVVTDSDHHHRHLLHRFAVRAKPRVKFNLSSTSSTTTGANTAHQSRSQTVLLGDPWAVSCEFVSALYSLNASIALLRCGQVQPQISKAKVGGGSPSSLWCGRPSLEALQEETRAWVAASRGRVVIRQRAATPPPFTTPVSISSSSSLPEKEHPPPVTSNTAVTLSVRSVRFEDVGYYLCAAENSLALSQAAVLLRVEDRYQAIWPAVLLLGLALYLFSLVVVFESRRYLATNFLKLDEDSKVS